MKLITLFILLFMVLFINQVYAAPNTADTTLANQYMDSLEDTQANYKSVHKKYEQVHSRMGARKLVYRMDEYKGECGVGYIVTVEKEIDAKLYHIQRHTGCETDRTIHTSWTQIN